MKPLVLGNLSYGMYAIGVKDGSRPNACIANTVMQISKATPSDAALVAVALSKENYSCQCVEQEGIFSISVLSQDTPATVIGALGFVSGRGVDKLGNIRHKVLIEGVPVIKEKIGRASCARSWRSWTSPAKWCLWRRLSPAATRPWAPP